MTFIYLTNHCLICLNRNYKTIKLPEQTIASLPNVEKLVRFKLKNFALGLKLKKFSQIFISENDSGFFAAKNKNLWFFRKFSLSVFSRKKRKVKKWKFIEMTLNIKFEFWNIWVIWLFGYFQKVCDRVSNPKNNETMKLPPD